jgi:transposase
MAYAAKITIEQVLPLMKQGMNIAEIADKLNVSQGIVYHCLRTHPNETNAVKESIERNKIEQMFTYIEQGMLFPEIEKKLGISKHLIRKYINSDPERLERIINKHWDDFKKAVLAHREKLGDCNKQDALYSRENLEKIFDLKKQGYTAQEIAKILGVPSPSFSFIYHYANSEGFHNRIRNLAYASQEKPVKQA